MKRTRLTKLTFIINIKAREISYLSWWKKFNKIISWGIEKLTKKIFKILEKVFKVYSLWNAIDLKLQLYSQIRTKLCNSNRITNIFNNYFNTIEENMLAKKILTKKLHWLSHQWKSWLFLSLTTNKEDGKLILSSLKYQ